MQANELRNGNKILRDGKIFTVSGILSHGIGNLESATIWCVGVEKGASIEKFGPIQITNEILKKSNLLEEPPLFTAPTHIKEESNKDIGIKYCSFFFNNRLNRWMEVQTRVCVDFVHEVQNLYFAYTKEEIEIGL